MVADPPSNRRRLAAFALLAACAAAAPACAQDGPITYPPSRSLADVAAWLRTDTPLSPAQVVDLGVSAATAITSAKPTGEPRGFLAVVSSESLDPTIAGQRGVASWSVPVEVDCEGRRVRLGTMTGFPKRDLASDPKTVRPADKDWISPTPEAPIGAVMRALCDRDFKRPFGSTREQARTSEPARPVPKAPLTYSRPAAPPAEAPKAPFTYPRPAAPPAEAAKPPAPKVAPPPAAATAPASATPARASGSSSAAIQVGASPDLTDAKGLLARVQKKFAAVLQGHAADVATVKVDGKTVHRALISGFGSTAEAVALCERLKAAGQACFVRR